MEIVIFNWRDIKNPLAGGSEIYFHELAKRWVLQGNNVTLICGGWKNCKKEELIDGVKIIRVGSPKTLYLLAPFAYLKLKIKPEIIIDAENGIPFFTPLYSKAKRILHIHHVHKEVWFKELNPLFAFIGWFLEAKIMPLIYKKNSVVTISESSKEEIEKLGLNVVGVVNPGIDFYRYKKFEKNEKPLIVFVNRIKKYKGLDILLKAINELNKSGLDFEVNICGSGDYEKEMKEYAKKNSLFNVKFLGKISENKKIELMQKAWAFINPSFKEGWGIVNIEANYLGTPVIGSNVSGIKDSVIDGKTGILFEYGNYKELAIRINKVLTDRIIREKMSKEAVKWAKNFNWDRKAKEYLNIIEDSI